MFIVVSLKFRLFGFINRVARGAGMDHLLLSPLNKRLLIHSYEVLCGLRTPACAVGSNTVCVKIKRRALRGGTLACTYLTGL